VILIALRTDKIVLLYVKGYRVTYNLRLLSSHLLPKAAFIIIILHMLFTVTWSSMLFRSEIDGPTDEFREEEVGLSIFIGM